MAVYSFLFMFYVIEPPLISIVKFNLVKYRSENNFVRSSK